MTTTDKNILGLLLAIGGTCLLLAGLRLALGYKPSQLDLTKILSEVWGDFPIVERLDNVIPFPKNP